MASGAEWGVAQAVAAAVEKRASKWLLRVHSAEERFTQIGGGRGCSLGGLATPSALAIHILRFEELQVLLTNNRRIGFVPTP